MAERPTIRVTKPALYKMVSFKGIDTEASTETSSGLKSTISAVNSLGGTLNSIAIAMEGVLSEMKKSTQIQIQNQAALTKYNAKRDAEEKLQQKRDEADRKKKLQRSKRDSDSVIKEGPMKKLMEGFAVGVAKTFGGLFGLLAGVAKWLLGGFIKFAVLDWIIKNPDKVKKLAKGLLAIAKFAYKITEFLVGSALDGLVKFLENPLSISGFFGAIQFVLSAAPLFAAMAVLKNPKLAVDGVMWVVKNLAKSLINIMKGSKIASKLKRLPGKIMGNKFGRAAVVGGGIGLASAAMFGGEDQSKASLAGSAVGGAAGYAAGEGLANAAGLGALAPVAGAAGAFVGGAIGGPIGEMLAPIIDPIKEFFGMVGDLFNAVFKPIKDATHEFFTALGNVMTKILDFIEPHMPLLKKIAGFFGTAAFLPLIALLKALTWILNFFSGAGGDKKPKKETTTKRASGGPVVTPVVVPQMAEGGESAAGGFNLPNINPFDPQSIQRQLITKVAALGELMRLPLKAIGLGIVSAIGKVSRTFAKFLPAPIKQMLGNLLNPIASAFGIPLSMLGLGGSEKGAEDSAQSGKDQERQEDGIGKVNEILAGGKESVLGLMGKLVGHLAERSKGPTAESDKAFKFWNPSTWFAEGGQVPQSLGGFAKGGWINGPMSGYPVSLDGGKSTSFIGHGLEWVGYPGRASGGSAFVVPFNTPATRNNKGLTGRRMKEAAKGGYALPFAAGGQYQPTTVKWNLLPQYAEGGQYDFFIGDSIASGFAGHNGPNQQLVSKPNGETMVGAQPGQVLQMISRRKDDIKGKTVFLSSGATNAYTNVPYDSIERQLTMLKQAGAKQVILGGVSSDAASKGYPDFKSEEINNKLKALAAAGGAGFGGSFTTTDGLHPSGSAPDPSKLAAPTNDSSGDSSSSDSTSSAETSEKQDPGKALEEALKKFSEAMKQGKGEAITSAILQENADTFNTIAQDKEYMAAMENAFDPRKAAASGNNMPFEIPAEGDDTNFIVTPPLNKNLEADPFQVSKFNPFVINNPDMNFTATIK